MRKKFASLSKPNFIEAITRTRMRSKATERPTRVPWINYWQDLRLVTHSSSALTPASSTKALPIEGIRTFCTVLRVRKVKIDNAGEQFRHVVLWDAGGGTTGLKDSLAKGGLGAAVADVNSLLRLTCRAMGR